MAAYAMALVLRSEGTAKGEVAEALGMMEPLCGIACARRPDRNATVVPELRTVNAEARGLADGDASTFNETMNRFHAALVQGCGNEALRLVTGALARVWRADLGEWVSDTVWCSRHPRPDERLESVESHERIAECIAAGDEAGVSAAMTDHNEVQRIYQEGVDPSEPVDPRAVRFGW